MYYIKHRHRVSRTMTLADITLDNIRAVRDLWDSEEDHEDPKLKVIFRDTECWTYIKVHQRRHNGRDAFIDLWTDYMGPNDPNSRANECDCKIWALSYQKESCHWDFEWYVKAHVYIHTILESLDEAEVPQPGLLPRRLPPPHSDASIKRLLLSPREISVPHLWRIPMTTPHTWV